MITGMVGLILVNGLGFFWPEPLTRLTLADGTSLLGEIVAREEIPQHGAPTPVVHRIQMKLGNRDLSGADFRWIDEAEIKGTEPAARGRLRRASRVRTVHRRAGPPERRRKGAGERGRRRLAGAAAAHVEG